MNTERTVILENTGDCSIGLADTQRRSYRLAKGAKMRISAVTLQDILDHPGSKIIFKEGMAKVSNITKKELYAMGLSEEEVDLFLLEEAQPTVVITETLDDEEKEEVTEEVIEVKEEKPVVEKKPAAKKSTTTAKKTTTKKSTSKKSA